MSRRATVRALGTLTALVALASCTSMASGPEEAAVVPVGETVSASPNGTSPSTEAAPAPETPSRTACYRLDLEEATAPTSDAPPVPCAKRHTAQTYHVGRLDTVVDGHLLAVDSRLAQRQLERTCPRRLDEYLGGTEQSRRLSRLRAVWFSPTIEQSDQGASWLRCDVVALGTSSTLGTLPAPSRLRGILDQPDALDEVGLCGTAAPGTTGFERVICARRHAWKAISTIDIAGGDVYPGAGVVRDAGEGTCRDQVEAASGSPDRFSYGWEWPTRRQWRGGQRFGYCWAPDST